MKAVYSKRTTERSETLEIRTETAEDREEIQFLARKFNAKTARRTGQSDNGQSYVNTLLNRRLKSLKEAKAGTEEDE